MSSAIVCCFKLHNLCIDFNDIEDDEHDEEKDEYFDTDAHLVDTTKESAEICEIISLFLEKKFRLAAGGLVVRR